MPGRFAVVVINYGIPAPGQAPEAAERAGLNSLQFAAADAAEMAALLRGQPGAHDV